MTTNFLRNRYPTRSIPFDKSPYQVWTGRKPVLANLKVFDCHAFVTVPKEKRSKLDARAKLCRFVGYSEHEKACRFEDVKTGRICISRDTKFLENVFDSGSQDYFQDQVADDVESTTDEEVLSDAVGQDEATMIHT
ncbi:retrovirus-related pol polyprotein from transposon tnt 1-94 [Plasmopara halstedii]|uniref:Retrovirus-related pol polyprotein from transposon tnt 1-94 n=1 Tax=Plasmopara halstedii TaxID=4781 RepID=A0A0P1B2S6_PLAHL|nr:retrovirus-related pol polyprotein from transposon tnt 1-94 [Plasmopara halstedii]CEG49028.1 retrovirus-related pol polyprotein from transposon tnt 1-94 [Plasmopara halstedii]|eukprot:XP_024585397.1 retrovirus-related pol polyprotein from transposon tnt 1-94 [Plasmopara halstedii]